ncbi:MAG: PSD1 domain-containing protein [Planctomycetales bacterium]|nr:PSD1 domain-containing protein [Planctomycetales bacterium]
MQIPPSRIALLPVGATIRVLVGFAVSVLIGSASLNANGTSDDVRFFEQRIRPLLVQHCYECHSEESGEQQGGLLLDRQSGWIEGGDTNKAVIPGEPDASLLIVAIRYDNEDLQMPPDGRLDDETIELFQQWIRRGAVGPADDMGETEFSRLGDQDYLFDKATDHWAFKPVGAVSPPPLTSVSPHASTDSTVHKLESKWGDHAIDRFVWNTLNEIGVTPSGRADPATIVRRLSYDLVGLPPSYDEVNAFVEAAKIDFDDATAQLVDRLIESPEYGQHLGRLWLDVVRYADTDNDYRPDTKTPHYYPFAFTYRDYVVDSLNSDKPYDQFLKEQLAADLMGFPADAEEMAALGFYATGPYANRAQTEAFDDWIDVTTRGLMGMTVACARCHDHKFEPVPTADYYSLRGVFAALTRANPLDEKKQPLLKSYVAVDSDVRDYQRKRSAIDAKISESNGKKTKGNNRSLVERIRETELAELLTFHPGAPARAMVVSERGKPPASFIFVRGDAAARGEAVPRRFLKVLDPQQVEFPSDASGRLELAQQIASSKNPLTARVFVNRIWGHLIGSHLVATPSDFGLQGSSPTHPELLDWLADDFVRHGWSVKHLVRRIVSTETYRQSSGYRDSAIKIDPENTRLWRANRKHLSIEAIRDSILVVSGQLDRQAGGHAGQLWGKEYTHRRAIYGFINRFNLDPTLRAFDFPAPVQSQPARGESIVAQQTLFTLNSPFVVDQASAIVSSEFFSRIKTDREKVETLFRTILGRQPAVNEVARSLKFVEFQQRFDQPDQKPTRFINSPWPLLAQALLMSNEFQYVD